MILNSVAPPTNLNPFNIPAAQGSLGDRAGLGPADARRPRRDAAALGRREGRPARRNTVNITLRKGMKWSDGQPVTIDDAVFSLEAPGYGDKAPMYKPFVTNIASVEAPAPTRSHQAEASRRRLPGQLARPSSTWRRSTSGQPIFEDLKGKPQTAESIKEEHPVSSGPFRIVRASLNQEIVLEANPRSLGASQDRALDHAHHAERRGIAGRAEERRDQLPVGLHRRSGAAAETSRSRSPTSRCREALDIGFKFIAYNERRPPFDNLAFRQALSAVIDRKLLAEDAWGGAAEPANSWISPALERLARQGDRGSRARRQSGSGAEDPEGCRLRAGRRRSCITPRG